MYVCACVCICACVRMSVYCILIFYEKRCFFTIKIDKSNHNNLIIREIN